MSDSVFTVAVCGGRGLRDADLINRTLGGIHRDRAIRMLVSGGCRGADALCEEWAIENDVPLTVFHPDWSTSGMAAGPVRNQRMLDEGEPDLLVAFPGGRGTSDMATRARNRNIQVMNLVP